MRAQRRECPLALERQRGCVAHEQRGVLAAPFLAAAEEPDEAIGVRVAELLAGLEALGLAPLDHNGKVGDPWPERRADG